MLYTDIVPQSYSCCHCVSIATDAAGILTTEREINSDDVTELRPPTAQCLSPNIATCYYDNKGCAVVMRTQFTVAATCLGFNRAF